MYDNRPYDREDERLPWIDLGELRKTVLALLDEDALEVPWQHLMDERHRVSHGEVRLALEDGTLDLHEAVDGRYSALHMVPGAPLAIVVFFELWTRAEARYIRVLTAYHAPAQRKRLRRR